MFILPTYRRPQRCQEMLDSICLAVPTSPGMVIVDGGDPEEYRDLRLPPGWTVHVSTRNLGFLGRLRWFFERHPDLEWYGLLQDDLVIRTAGWDVELRNAAGRTGFASCNDLSPTGDGRMAGAQVFGGDLLRALGWWAPPGLHHTYCDNVWEHIGRTLGNWKTLKTVITEHRHAFNGKAPIDATYRKAYGRNDEDKATFMRLMSGEIPAAIRHAKTTLFPAAVASEEARLERVRSRSVMLCTPIARNPVWQYTLSYAETCVLLDKLGVRFASKFVVGSSNLPRARNVLVARALAAGFDSMIFIDDDMGWKANDIVRLLASEQSVIGGVGRKKVEAQSKTADIWCCKFFEGCDRGMNSDEMGNIEVHRLGTGFLKIDMSVFRALAAAHPEWKRDGSDDMEPEVRKNYYQFFKFDQDEQEMGEDFVFCDRWRDVGGTVWIDPTINLIHVGDKAYSGAIIDVMEDAGDQREHKEAAE